MTIKYVLLLVGIVACCCVTGLGGYYSALRTGHSRLLWAMFCTVCPPAYVCLLRDEISKRADKPSLNLIECMALLVSAVFLLFAAVVIGIIALIWILGNPSEKRTSFSGRRHGSSSVPSGGYSGSGYSGDAYCNDSGGGYCGDGGGGSCGSGDGGCC